MTGGLSAPVWCNGATSERMVSLGIAWGRSWGCSQGSLSSLQTPMKEMSSVIERVIEAPGETHLQVANDTERLHSTGLTCSRSSRRSAASWIIHLLVGA
jgi:hypothetical protein